MKKTTKNESEYSTTNHLDLSGVGRQITKARNRLNVTKKDAVKNGFISAQLFSKIENGENLPSLSSFAEVARLLDVPADILLQDCHKDFLIHAIDDYLGRIDINETDIMLARLNELMRKDDNE